MLNRKRFKHLTGTFCQDSINLWNIEDSPRHLFLQCSRKPTCLTVRVSLTSTRSRAQIRHHSDMCSFAESRLSSSRPTHSWCSSFVFSRVFVYPSLCAALLITLFPSILSPWVTSRAGACGCICVGIRPFVHLCVQFPKNSCIDRLNVELTRCLLKPLAFFHSYWDYCSWINRRRSL